MLSIVIPAFNEESRLPATLAKIEAWARGGPGRPAETIEIIVVDDASRDATAACVERAAVKNARVVRFEQNRGKGAAFKEGFAAATGEWVLLTDADLSTPIEEVERLRRMADEGRHDLVIGSRALPDSQIEQYQPFHRWLMGQTFNRLVRLMTGLPYRDTQCGFKLMRRERVAPVVARMQVDRFAFDVELLYLARRAGLSILEAPVRWKNSPASRVGLIGDPLNMLADIAGVVKRERGA